jgi:hypothetical protein
MVCRSPLYVTMKWGMFISAKIPSALKNPGKEQMTGPLSLHAERRGGIGEHLILC